jgi:hypothetical protein
MNFTTKSLQTVTMNVIIGFQNIINICLTNFFVLDDRLVCRDYLVKFVVSLTSLFVLLIRWGYCFFNYN